jgi:hypothetical protein
LAENASTVEQQDVERIAHAALKELGVFGAELRVTSDPAHPGSFQIDIQGSRGPGRLRIKCGQGTTPQWVRQQIFEQYLAQS